MKSKHVTVDFERAFVNAAEESFNGVDISGCFFHFTQCIWREIKGTGLKNFYSDSADNADVICASVCATR